MSIWGCVFYGPASLRALLCLFRVVVVFYEQVSLGVLRSVWGCGGFL